MTTPFYRPQPAARSVAPVTVRSPSITVSSTAMFPQRTGGGNRSNQEALAKLAQKKDAVANDTSPVAPKPLAKLPPLSTEVRAQMDAGIDNIVRILKQGTPDSGDQTRLLEEVRKWERKDHELSAQDRGGRRTPMLDHFLSRLKARAYSRSSFRSLWQDQYAIAYDTLWYELRGYWLEEFKRVVKQSETQSTKGAESKDVENGAALIAKQEAMGLWGMLKGMGTGLVSIAGPEAAQYIGGQFDETAHILFGHEWDSSEPLVFGMNAGQIGTAGGDVIMQLVMLARSAGAKGGKVLQLINNLEKFKKAQQVLAALGGIQGMLMATKGIMQVIQAKREAGQEITAKTLIDDPVFVNQVVMLVSSGIGTAMAIKGAPASAQQALIHARVGVLLGTLQITASISELAQIAQSNDSEIEKELAYGRVLAGLIPQLVSLVIAGHGQAQVRKDAKAERQQQAQGKAAAVAKARQEAEVKPKPPATQAETQTGTHTDAGQKGMSKPDLNVAAAKPTNTEIEQARQKVTDVHQARMADEVTNRLVPRDASPVVADVAAGQREPLYHAPKQGSVTVGEPHASLPAAQALYDRVILETGGNREVGIWHHPDTGDYIVRLGQPTTVNPPRDTTWQGVQHFHSNKADVPLWRMPSGADVSELAGRAMGQQRTMTELVEYPLPNGKRGRAAYTVTPDGKLTVAFIKSDGTRVTKTFDGAKDYGSYHPSRKVFDSESIRTEVDQWLADRRQNEAGPEPVPGAKGMNTAAPKKTNSLETSTADDARARWAQSGQAEQGKKLADVWASKTPEPDEHSFKDLADELKVPAAAIQARSAGASKKGPPPVKLPPPSIEKLVAVRFRGDSKNKGYFIEGPEFPASQDRFTMDKKTYLKGASKAFKKVVDDPAFLVLPASQARAMGFVGKGEDFKSGPKQQPVAVSPVFTPYQQGGKTMESRHADSESHPISARTSPKRTTDKAKQAWDRTIAPSLEESESYKFQMASKGELGLKRAGNASERGADHITVDLNSNPPKIYLNDATTPDLAKKPKATHKTWLADFKEAFPPNNQGVRGFGFDARTNAKINAALDAGEVYTRTLRPQLKEEFVIGKKILVDKTVLVNGEPMREYIADDPVKVGRKSAK